MGVNGQINLQRKYQKLNLLYYKLENRKTKVTLI